MRKSIQFTIVFLLMISVKTFGQDNNLDALSKLFSQSVPTGSARIQALGGNHSALGADVSSASGNPAGLGFYTRSEFSFTPAFQSLTNSTAYITNSSTSASKDNFNIANIGVVFGGSEPTYRDGWRGNFAITYSRQNAFYNNIKFGARNNVSSIADQFAEDASSEVRDLKLGLNDFNNAFNQAPNFDLARHAYFYSFLITPLRNNQGDLTGFVGTEGSNISDQKFAFESSGRSSQWNIAYGGTANEKVYLGFALGVPSFRYEAISTYDEDNINSRQFTGLTQSKIYATSGSGLNFSVGTIIKPNDILRFGLSVTTPTWYDVDESFSSTLRVGVNTAQIGQSGGGVLLPNGNDANTLNVVNTLRERGYSIIDRNGNRFLGGVPTLNFPSVEANYQLNTPFKANLGAAVFFKKKGFVSADVEYLAYKGIKMSSTEGAPFYEDYTGFVRSDVVNVFNFKVGGEYRTGPISFRGGVNYQADPSSIAFKARSAKVDRSMMIYSGGVGYRSDSFYVDLTGVYGTTTQTYIPYVLSNRDFVPTANINTSFIKGLVTFGVFF